MRCPPLRYNLEKNPLTHDYNEADNGETLDLGEVGMYCYRGVDYEVSNTYTVAEGCIAGVEYTCVVMDKFLPRINKSEVTTPYARELREKTYTMGMCIHCEESGQGKIKFRKDMRANITRTMLMEMLRRGLRVLQEVCLNIFTDPSAAFGVLAVAMPKAETARSFDDLLMINTELVRKISWVRTGLVFCEAVGVGVAVDKLN